MKIQYREFPVINPRRLVIGPCGLLFIGEIAEMPSVAIKAYGGVPFFLALAIIDASVLGRALNSTNPITRVLGTGGETQILSRIVKADAVAMVNNNTLRGIGNKAVHMDDPAAVEAGSIIGFAGGLKDLPGIFGQFPVIFGVNEGIAVFFIDVIGCHKFYPAKGEAVMFFAIAQYEIKDKVFDDIRDFYAKVKIHHFLLRQ